MKRIIAIVGLIILLAVPAFAQWNQSIVGATYVHRDTISWTDVWFGDAGATANTDSSLELAGYNSVRADYDVSSESVYVSVNMQCSNDSLWVSGDSITITKDTSAVYDLMGCKDYNFYIESMSAGDDITIYLTPFND